MQVNISTINATPIVIGEKCWLATDVFVAPRRH